LNPIYRNIRKEAFTRGVRFSWKGHEAYYAFPLIALDNVIDSRVVPFRPNFRWLEVLEREAPGAFTIKDLKRGELQFNYLFHESAHLIAHSEFFGKCSPKRLPKSRNTLLGIMIGEAFANVVECLSSAIVEGEIGSYFLDANCHFRASEKDLKALMSGAARWGWPKTAKVLMGAFLYSNFLFERLNRREVARIAEFAGLSSQSRIKSLVQVGLALNEKFRTTTTPFHLRKLGFGRELPKLFSVDPLHLLLKPEFRKSREAAERLAEIAARC
jgi:hypothetical protein